MSDYQIQAKVFSKYLVGQEPSAQAIELYQRAIKDSPSLSANDRKLMDFAIKHPWSISYLDGGLAFWQPNAQLRSRLYAMLAILETMPNLADEFLPQKHSPFYIFAFLGYGLRGIFKAMIGSLLIKVVG